MAEKECYQTRPECDDDDCSNCPIWLREELRKKDEKIKELKRIVDKVFDNKNSEAVSKYKSYKQLEKQLAEIKDKLPLKICKFVIEYTEEVHIPFEDTKGIRKIMNELFEEEGHVICPECEDEKHFGIGIKIHTCLKDELFKEGGDGDEGSI